MDLPVKLRRISESAFEFYWQGKASKNLSQLIIAFRAALKKEFTQQVRTQHLFEDGLIELIPGLNSLAIYLPNSSKDLISKIVYDMQAWSENFLTKEQNEGMTLVNYQNQFEKSRVVQLPCVYEGLDLKNVASALNLTESEVKMLHQGSEFLLALKGFQEHFPYMIGLEPKLKLARKGSPLKRVPSGSVAIAEEMCGIYPQTSPGGWHLLGKTHAELLSFLKIGDRIQFVEVSSLGAEVDEEEFLERFVIEQ